MKNSKKLAMIAGIVALGFSVSGCNSGSANPAAEKSPDPAEMTAAAIDQSAPAPVEPAPEGVKAAESGTPAAK